MTTFRLRRSSQSARTARIRSPHRFQPGRTTDSANRFQPGPWRGFVQDSTLMWWAGDRAKHLIPSSCRDAIPLHHRTLAAEWRSRASGFLPATPTVIPRKLLSTMVSEPKAHRALDQPPPVEVGEPVEHVAGVMVATMQPVSEARPRRSAPHHARWRRESAARAATRPQRPWRRRARPRRRPRCQSRSTIIVDAPG